MGLVKRKFSPENLTNIECIKSPEKEVKFFNTRPVKDHERYHMLRAYSRAAQKNIVDQVFNRFLDHKNIESAEFGCGAYGCLYNILIPRRFKRKWRQYDINPQFVKSNKRFTHFSLFDWRTKVYEGNIYDMPFDNSSLDLITGLSAWDSVTHSDKAMQEVSRCLKPNGLFIHFQDLLPPEVYLLNAEYIKRKEKGLTLEFETEYERVTTQPVPWFTFQEDHLMSLESTDEDNSIIPVGRYLSNHLAHTATKLGLTVLLNEEITNTALQKRRDFMRIGLHKFAIDKNYGGHNVYEYSMYKGNTIHYHDPSIPKEYVRVTSTMDVLVAKK